jgi:hypothetical protein
MRTNSRRRDQGLALAVLTVVLSLPDLAWAQQSGLFPLAPIKRQRVPCDQEDPIYKTYKYQYFGYYPTCWRPFPKGWGCPSSEVASKEKSLNEIPLGPRPAPGEGQPANPDLKPAPGGPDMRPAVPTLPEGGRSPFELDRPGNAPGAAPGTPGTRQPAPTGPGNVDPFIDQPAPGTGTGQPRGDASSPTISPPLSGNDVPDLSAPADQPRRIQGTRLAHREDEDQLAPGESGDAPLLALPDIAVPALDPSGSTTPANSASNSATTGGSPAPRRGLISGFFNNLGWNWTRR